MSAAPSPVATCGRHRCARRAAPRRLPAPLRSSPDRRPPPSTAPAPNTAHPRPTASTSSSTPDYTPPTQLMRNGRFVHHRRRQQQRRSSPPFTRLALARAAACCAPSARHMTSPPPAGPPWRSPRTRHRSSGSSTSGAGGVGVRPMRPAAPPHPATHRLPPHCRLKGPRRPASQAVPRRRAASVRCSSPHGPQRPPSTPPAACCRS